MGATINDVTHDSMRDLLGNVVHDNPGFSIDTNSNDVVMDTSEDPVLKDMMQLAGEQAAETIELVIWGVARAGTNVFFGAAADTSRSDVNDAISLPRQRAITRFLKAQRAKVITEMQSSSIKFGTEAIAAAFIAIGHTNLENDIRDLPGFTAVERYGSMQPLPFEVGRIEDVRYILSPALTVFASAGSASLNGMVTTNGTNVDVYPIIYLGREALGTVALKGSEAITPMVLNPNQPRGGDPAGQRGTVSWKILYAAVILNQSWMARLEVGATDIGAPQ